jgi:hypothetical protein
MGQQAAERLLDDLRARHGTEHRVLAQIQRWRNDPLADTIELPTIVGPWTIPPASTGGRHRRHDQPVTPDSEF